MFMYVMFLYVVCIRSLGNIIVTFPNMRNIYVPANSSNFENGVCLNVCMYVCT